jgi:hypothetical protein
MEATGIDMTEKINIQHHTDGLAIQAEIKGVIADATVSPVHRYEGCGT